MDSLVGFFLPLIERRGLIPDFAIRIGIRRMLQNRLDLEIKDPIASLEAKQDFIQELKSSVIAMSTDEANQQHYEVPSEFYNLVLDQKYLKYSSCYFGFEGPNTKEIKTTLEDASHAMMMLYVERADLKNGQTILDLGCGWGSLTLFLAEQFPQSKIISVSNSSTQKQHIDQQCQKRNLTNVTVKTADINKFDIEPNTFDRIISIEMFEHMKNYQELMHRVSRWLKLDGKLFVQIFAHVTFPYHFIPVDESDWMARHFFTNGTMPSDDLLLYFQRDLTIKQHWRVDGRNYGMTSNYWLQNIDKHHDRVHKLFAETYGEADAYMWIVRWRLFFIAVEETFNFNEGRNWLVSHYLFEKLKAAL